MKTRLFTKILTLTRRVFPSGCRLKHDVATKAALKAEAKRLRKQIKRQGTSK